MNPFQAWYRKVMERHGWSLNRMARLLGVAPASAFGHYHGRALPGPALQRKLAEITGEPLDAIRAMVWESEELRAAARRPPVPPRPLSPGDSLREGSTVGHELGPRS